MDFMCSTVILKIVCPIPISVTTMYAIQNQSMDMPKFRMRPPIRAPR